MLARFAIAAMLAGCAAPSAQDFCVQRAVDFVSFEGKVHQLPGRCKAWELGPTPKQREEFDKRKQQRGGA